MMTTVIATLKSRRTPCSSDDQKSVQRRRAGQKHRARDKEFVSDDGGVVPTSTHFSMHGSRFCFWCVRFDLQAS